MDLDFSVMKKEILAQLKEIKLRECRTLSELAIHNDLENGHTNNIDNNSILIELDW